MEFRICHLITGTLEGIFASSWFWFISERFSVLFLLIFFLHIARSLCLKAHTEETDTQTTVPSPSALVLLCIHPGILFR